MAELQSLAVELPDGIDAVELHGLICGVVCADPAGDAEMRRRAIIELLGQDAELLGDSTDDASLEIDDPLARFIAASSEGLAAADLRFAPLLPDDEERLGHRLEALAAWCAGFLAGYRAFADPRTLPADGREAFEDIEQLAAIDTVSQNDDVDRDESDFAEVVEYLRIAVLLLLRGTGSDTEAGAHGRH